MNACDIPARTEAMDRLAVLVEQAPDDEIASGLRIALADSMNYRADHLVSFLNGWLGVAVGLDK